MAMNGSDYILVTGASSGLGAATAHLLSERHNLIVSGRNEARLAAVRDACARHGHDVRAFAHDLTHADTVAAALRAWLREQAVPVTAFAHFAGMTELLPVSKTKYHVGLDVMNVNYFAATEIISTLLKRRVNGSNLNNILLITSIVVRTGVKYQPHYCASKGALTSLVRALALELAPQVRVNAIAPGSFDTPIMHTLFLGEAPQTPTLPPLLQPAGTVDDIARTARFLLEDDSRYITGQVIGVDGGQPLIGMV